MSVEQRNPRNEVAVDTTERPMVIKRTPVSRDGPPNIPVVPGELQASDGVSIGVGLAVVGVGDTIGVGVLPGVGEGLGSGHKKFWTVFVSNGTRRSRIASETSNDLSHPLRALGDSNKERKVMGLR